MPPPPKPFARADAATQRALISELLGRDDELRELSTTMLKVAITQYIDLMVRGDTATRVSLVRAFATPITKALTESDDDEGDQTLRAEMQQMMAEMRGEMGLDDETLEDVQEPEVGGVGKVMVPKS